MNSPNIRELQGNDETRFWEVESLSRPGLYFDVIHDLDHHWLCTCEQYYFRKVFCKHMKICAELACIEDTMVYAEVC